MLREGTGSEKRLEDPKFTPQADSWDRHSLQQLKTKTKPGNSGTGTESDFQKDHNIKFKCPVFNNKNCKAYKEIGKYGPFKTEK